MNVSYPISTDNPLPPRHSISTVWRLPFDKLTVGASFFVPGGHHASSNGVCRARRLLFPARFSVRMVIEDGVSGVRIWRTH